MANRTPTLCHKQGCEKCYLLRAKYCNGLTVKDLMKLKNEGKLFGKVEVW